MTTCASCRVEFSGTLAMYCSKRCCVAAMRKRKRTGDHTSTCGCQRCYRRDRARVIDGLLNGTIKRAIEAAEAAASAELRRRADAVWAQRKAEVESGEKRCRMGVPRELLLGMVERVDEEDEAA